jgi:hypothetical protein
MQDEAAQRPRARSEIVLQGELERLTFGHPEILDG